MFRPRRRRSGPDPVISLALAFALAAVAPQQPADPLGPAREGRLQCHSPGAARKTCGAIATYSFAADGTISNQAEVMLNPSPLIVMRDQIPVVVRDGAVCGPLTGLEGEGWLAEAFIDGRPRPDLNQPVIWVSPTDGYSVRP